MFNLDISFSCKYTSDISVLFFHKIYRIFATALKLCHKKKAFFWSNLKFCYTNRKCHLRLVLDFCIWASINIRKYLCVLVKNPHNPSKHTRMQWKLEYKKKKNWGGYVCRNVWNIPSYELNLLINTSGSNTFTYHGFSAELLEHCEDEVRLCNI